MLTWWTSELRSSFLLNPSLDPSLVHLFNFCRSLLILVDSNLIVGQELT